MKTTRLSVLAALAIANAGCSDPGSSPGGASTTASGTGGSTSTSSSSGGGGEPATCEGEVVHGSGVEITIDTVEATVYDAANMPVPAKVLAQVCGINLCKNGETDANGHVFVTVGQLMKQPAFKFGDGKTYAKIARPLTDPATVFPSVFTAAFPPLGEGAALLPGQDASNADVTLSVPEGAVIEYDILLSGDPAEYLFRAVKIDPQMMDPAVVNQDPGLQMFYAFAPLDTQLCPAAKVTVPNDAGFSSGAAVEFFVQGLNVAEEFAPYAAWNKVSDGEVSADGMTISTSDGGGLPLLTVMGVRLKI